MAKIRLRKLGAKGDEVLLMEATEFLFPTSGFLVANRQIVRDAQHLEEICDQSDEDIVDLFWCPTQYGG